MRRRVNDYLVCVALCLATFFCESQYLTTPLNRLRPCVYVKDYPQQLLLLLLLIIILIIKIIKLIKKIKMNEGGALSTPYYWCHDACAVYEIASTCHVEFDLPF